MTTQNKTIARRFFEEIIATGDWSRADQIVLQNIVMHHPSSPEPVAGLDAVSGFIGAFRAGFPDFNMKVEDVFGEDDKVAVRWQMTGTHNADLFGIPPSGKKVTIPGTSIVRLENGKIAEDWVNEDSDRNDWQSDSANRSHK